MINTNINHFDKLTHIIYYEWFLDIRGGGPTGYLANLLDGLNRIDNNDNPLIFFNNDIKTPGQISENPKGIHLLAHKFFYQNSILKSFYINHVSRYQHTAHDNYVDFLKNYDNMFCNPNLFNNINFDCTKTIHVHTVGDAVKVKNSLTRLNISNVKILLTCHTPETPSNEYYKTYLEQGHNQARAMEIKHGWSLVERKAFEYSDILVFPSKESMEPLLLTMNGFSNIIQNKDIRFIETGAKKLHSSLTKEEAKKKYGVSGKFVIGYVGRHNEIKGYDILQKAAQIALSQNENICFLIGGSQGNTFSPLAHERWIEAGWVNPADLFTAIDVFILPNRMTYYDLVLLEVMSMGVPVIASSTGGNKSVHEKTNALILYDNSAEDLAKKILDFSACPVAEIEKIGQETLSAYETNFTPALFAERYRKLINQIYSDYHFI